MDGRAPIRTGLGGEDVLVVKEVLHPCHHVVDVGGCGELDALAVLVDPGVVQAGRRRSVRSATACRDVSIYPHLGPADMEGHVLAVQHSASTP